MLASKAIALMRKYAKCPDCGSDSIGKGYGEMTVNENVFIRRCQCGYEHKVSVKEKK